MMMPRTGFDFEPFLEYFDPTLYEEPQEEAPKPLPSSHSYLVVAHRTATSPELLQTVIRLAEENPQAAFTLLVPVSLPSTLVYEDSQLRAAAERVGEEARDLLFQYDVALKSVIVGDSSPLAAIDDELRAHPEAYGALVLSTLPPGISRWLRLDVHRQAERRFGLPVIHVIATSHKAERVAA